MSKATPATRALTAAGVAFTVHTYDYDPDAESIGLQAAAALGEDPARLLKTQMAQVDGKPAQMMKPPEAERVTGYKVGGISPFGQRKQVPTVIEQRALAHDLVYLN